jgi:hypothetical protein
MIIRLALISSLSARRTVLKNGISQFGKFETVYEGEDFSRDTKKLVSSQPDIVIVAPSEEEYKKLNPRRFELLIQKLPAVKALLITQLGRDHPFVRSAVDYGANVLDDRHDYHEIANGIERITKGEHLELYKSRRLDLENHRRGKER